MLQAFCWNEENSERMLVQCTLTTLVQTKLRWLATQIMMLLCRSRDCIHSLGHQVINGQLENKFPHLSVAFISWPVLFYSHTLDMFPFAWVCFWKGSQVPTSCWTKYLEISLIADFASAECCSTFIFVFLLWAALIMFVFFVLYSALSVWLMTKPDLNCHWTSPVAT